MGGGWSLSERTFAFTATLQSSANSVQLRELELQEDFGQAILGTVNNRNIRTAILSGLLPAFRQILDKGPSWNANDLMGLSSLSSTWPSRGCVGIYLRLYTHQDMDHQNLHVFAIYIRHTRKFQKRNQSHLATVRNGTERHYQVARKSPKEHRHVFPVCVWTGTEAVDLPPGTLHAAEQTLISFFGSYHACVPHMTDRLRSSKFVLEVTKRVDHFPTKESAYSYVALITAARR
ncbi:hypothetical protein MRS44_010188 [Fusarium solani]|uniref:uncharacterized protein n=1 Tax=Fusarium solani TaxID=169388 RepID=UPI0032C4951D|nr:hypothetical protein MRS44_010188 [Fusarium solani]